MIQVKKLSWEDVVNGGNFLGGHIEVVKDDDVYSGSIVKIEIHENSIWLTYMWFPRIENGKRDDWVMTYANIDKKVELQDVGEGGIHFSAEPLGVCTVSPKKHQFSK